MNINLQYILYFSIIYSYLLKNTNMVQYNYLSHHLNFRVLVETKKRNLNYPLTASELTFAYVNYYPLKSSIIAIYCESCE